MSRKYSVSFTDIAVTVVQDLFQLEANTPTKILGVYISQRSDVGDAEAEGLSIQIKRVTDVITNVAAEVQMDQGDAAAVADLVINDTVQLVAGEEIIHSECWNIAMPFVYLPIPELRPWIRVDDSMVVDLNTAPNDELTMSGTMYFEEFGS